MAENDVIANGGYCHCCRTETIFKSSNSWLRDYYICKNCKSIPRQRHLQFILDKYFIGWEDLKLHESSPSNDLISRYCKSYSTSQFFSDVSYGAEVKGVRCENLESLTFADNTFDIFITQDVFEHIFNPNLAASEIMRVLKPGGAHVFTAPKHKGILKSYPRAKLVNGQVVNILDEQFHGNPIGDGRSLVTWDYGDDFECFLFEWTKCPTTTYVTRDRRLGIDGEYLEVFVTRKI
ncbi:MAG: class I SAM-dependent methyltransferase [Methylococcales bacterium]|nr:class I SAM-dependent methyltransferase [Methylococcales bacterium]